MGKVINLFTRESLSDCSYEKPAVSQDEAKRRIIADLLHLHPELSNAGEAVRYMELLMRQHVDAAPLEVVQPQSEITRPDIA